MNTSLTFEQKNQFNELLESLGENLDISEAEFNAAVKSYEAVGSWLSKPDSLLAPYKPIIRPQGSFLLGTMIKTVTGKDDLDIDLVCQLTGKRFDWTQYDLKQKVGDQLKDNAIYRKMLEMPDGRRCWTLNYSDTANYHMDILAAIVSEDFKIILESSFSAMSLKNFEGLAIRITDKLEANYRMETDPHKWLKSNPFGYGKWFYQRASLETFKLFSINEAIKPVPKYQKDKLPLQRVVQILKRHRDIMFDGDEDKPISIIITTLAAKAYNKESNIIDALINVIQKMPELIEERFDIRYNKRVKWIGNPINEQENFADKWPLNPQKQQNFYDWMARVQLDLRNITGQRGMHLIQEAMAYPFGQKTVNKVFSNYGDKLRELREDGKQYIAPKTGIIGTVGTLIKNHNFHGKSE